MTPTLRYLARETALRWRTRPSSPLARGVLTFTLAATAGGFLAGFAASADALRTQLARFGFDTLVVRAIDVGTPTASASVQAEHWSHPLAADGTLAVLQQSPALATTAWGQPVTVFVAPWSVLRDLIPASAPAPTPPAVWLTRSWPAGRTTTFQLADGGTVSAVSRAPDGPWHALLEGDALLVPPELAPASAGARGQLDVVLFTPRDAATLPGWVRAVRALFTADGLPEPAIQDPGPLRAALATLEQGQQVWRSVVLGLLGLGVLLVFAAIGVLEQRETRFAQALLRSLGLRRRLLWLASLGENLLLANAALAAALLAVHLGAGPLLAQISGAAGTPARLPLSVAVFLAVVVNAGVLASLVPLAAALRQPLGRQLA